MDNRRKKSRAHSTSPPPLPDPTLWSNLCTTLTQFHALHSQSQSGTEKYNKNLAKITSFKQQEKLKPKHINIFLDKYHESIDDLVTEQILLEKATTQLTTLIASHDDARHKKIYEKHVHGDRDRKKVKGINTDIIPPGTLVAAKPDDADWLLANIITYRPSQKKYEVEDADDEDLGQKTYTLPPKCIIPIPNEAGMIECEVGEEVLALYPNTTCFYKAVVVRVPVLGGTGAVRFDEDGDIDRSVDWNMVLGIPKAYR